MIDPSLRLRRAIHANDTLLCARILKSHPALLHNPDYSTAAGLSNTSLHLACALGHLSLVVLLVQRGHERAGISLNEEHQTPLMLAARAGHTEVVNYLCCPPSSPPASSQKKQRQGQEREQENGEGDEGKQEEDDAFFPYPAIERQDIRGRDAVMFASQGGHDTCLQILLTFAPTVPKPSAYFPALPPSPSLSPSFPSSAFSPPTTTTSSPSIHPESASISTLPGTPAQRALLRHADIDGNTALHYASSNGHLLVLRTLLAAGADAERRNVWSWTAVSYSATVAAEVYFKNLIGEVGGRNRVAGKGMGVKGPGVRLVGGAGGGGAGTGNGGNGGDDGGVGMQQQEGNQQQWSVMVDGGWVVKRPSAESGVGATP